MIRSELSFLARSLDSILDSAIVSVHWTRVVDATSQSMKEILPEPVY